MNILKENNTMFDIHIAVKLFAPGDFLVQIKADFTVT